MIRIKRIYEPAEKRDGRRFLVDRFWPRGIKKDAMEAEAWVKEAAPSGSLCKWFGHEPAKWNEFRRRYSRELDERPESWKPLIEAGKAGDITLLFSARDTEHNNAVALKAYLERKLA